MKLKYTILAMLCSIAAPQMLSAQAESGEEPWSLEGNVGLNFNQASFSNWAAGGENSLGINALLNYSADYKRDKHLFENRLELSYGFNKNESTGPRKTTDKIYLSSVYGYEISKNLYFGGLMTFQTQFANGYLYGDDEQTLVSTFMAPGYLTLGCGLTWTPKSWISATLTPATWREVFVADQLLSDQGSFGVSPGKRSFAELGANLQAVVNKDIMENVNLYSRLILFSNYLEDAQNVDVDWEVQINLKINKWLSAFVTTNLVYDDTINILREDGTSGPALQFKELLGIGVQLTL
ncbi:MAG: DUF3078 domain-containing protein [Rikenellaceae bacterium]